MTKEIKTVLITTKYFSSNESDKKFITFNELLNEAIQGWDDFDLVEFQEKSVCWRLPLHYGSR